MVWSKPFSDIEIAYIEKEWQQLGTAEIASRLKRSKRGVENIVKKLGLRESCAPVCARVNTSVDDEPDGKDELDELIELKRLQKIMLRTCTSSQHFPKLSAEYRETLKQIEELKNGNEGGRLDGGGELLGIVSLRPS